MLPFSPTTLKPDKGGVTSENHNEPRMLRGFCKQKLGGKLENPKEHNPITCRKRKEKIAVEVRGTIPEEALGKARLKLSKHRVGGWIVEVSIQLIAHIYH